MKALITSLVATSILGFAAPLPAAAPSASTGSSQQLSWQSPLQQMLYEQVRASGDSTLRSFYESRDYQPVWLAADGEWSYRPDAFAEAIAHADEEGLNPQAYKLDAAIREAAADAAPHTIAQQELRITRAVMDFLSDLRYGSIRPQSVFPNFFTPSDTRDMGWVLQQVLEQGADRDAIAAQAPQSSEYRRLREALYAYRTLAEQGGWEEISSGGVIKPGQVDERIPAIRERLKMLGRIDEPGFFESLKSRFAIFGGEAEQKKAHPVFEKAELSEAERAEAMAHPDRVYEGALVPAIAEFQERRGAEVDGVIGPETFAELNVPVEERIDQILMAMERWRWLPRDLGERYVFVNTAGYYAKAVENGETWLTTPIIVGQVAHPTPSFSSHITDVKYYPDWTVPSSIAQRYVLDKIRNNPAVVDTLGYELYAEDGSQVPLNMQTISQLDDSYFPPYRFRQKPGPSNALGLVRFSVENDYAIYLHDTPKDSLFEENDRNFSSGCVRVGEPARMAQFLLAGNSALSAAEAAAKLNVEGQPDLDTQIVPLEQPVPVHIMYMTAWVDDEGNVRFEGDPYGRDAKLKTAMGL